MGTHTYKYTTIRPFFKLVKEQVWGWICTLCIIFQKFPFYVLFIYVYLISTVIPKMETHSVNNVLRNFPERIKHLFCNFKIQVGIVCV